MAASIKTPFLASLAVLLGAGAITYSLETMAPPRSSKPPKNALAIEKPKAASTTEASSRLFTVEETMGLAFSANLTYPAWRFVTRANPAAVDALNKVLDNDELHQFHRSVWRILGDIGGTSHVGRIEREIERLKEIPGLRPLQESGTLGILFRSLGVMARRDIEEASGLVDRLQDVDYWEGAKCEVAVHPESRGWNNAYDAIHQVMRGYALSRRPDVAERCRTVI